MNLADLGINPDDFEWYDLSLCLGMPSTFFAERYESSAEFASAADSMCEVCPVRQQCADYMRKLDPKPFGIMAAGIYWTWGKPDREKNRGKDLEWLS